MLKKVPPTYTLPLVSNANEVTDASAFGFHPASAAPVPLVDRRARLLRVWPPTLVNVPPTYSLPLLSAIIAAIGVATVPTVGFGFHVASAAPVPVAESLARLARDRPPTFAKAPPANTLLLAGSNASAVTPASAFGFHVASA